MRGRSWAGALTLALLLSGCAQPPAAETPSPTPEPTAEATVSPVWSDWSKLEPYAPPEPVYTRRYPDPTDTLLPAGDYGPLIPFQGGRLSRGSEWGGWEDFFFLYGLVTLKGEVVLDPVLTGYIELATLPRGGPDVLLLSKMVPGPEGTAVERSALCARDGSWCTDFVYEYDWDQLCDRGVEGGLPLLREGRYYVLLDPETGAEKRTVDLTPALAAGMEYPRSLLYGPVVDSPYLSFYDTLGGRDQCCLLNGDTGEVVPLPQEVSYVTPFSPELFCGYTDRGCGLLSPDGTWAVEPTYQRLTPTGSGLAVAQDANGNWQVLSGLGEVLLSIPAGFEHQWTAEGYCKFTQGEQTLILNPDGQLRTFPPGTWATVQEGWFIYDEGEELVFQRGEEEHRLPAVDGDIFSIQGDYVLFGTYGGPVTLGNLVTGELRALDPELGSFYPLFQDPISGRVYLESYREDGLHSLLDHTGTLLAQFQGGSYYVGYSPVGDLLRHVTESEFELLDREGNVVFRWLIPLGMD